MPTTGNVGVPEPPVPTSGSRFQNFLALARRRSVMRRAIATALVVGPILTAINHGPALLSGHLLGDRLIQIGLTFLVPYAVSTYAAVAAIQDCARANLAPPNTPPDTPPNPEPNP